MAAECEGCDDSNITFVDAEEFTQYDGQTWCTNCGEQLVINKAAISVNNDNECTDCGDLILTLASGNSEIQVIDTATHFIIFIDTNDVGTYELVLAARYACSESNREEIAININIEECNCDGCDALTVSFGDATAWQDLGTTLNLGELFETSVAIADLDVGLDGEADCGVVRFHAYEKDGEELRESSSISLITKPDELVLRIWTSEDDCDQGDLVVALVADYSCATLGPAQAETTFTFEIDECCECRDSTVSFGNVVSWTNF